MRLLLILLALCGSARADGKLGDDVKKLLDQMIADTAAWKPAPIEPKTLRGLIDALGGDEALERGAKIEGSLERTADGATVQVAMTGGSDVFKEEGAKAAEDAAQESNAVNRPHILAHGQTCEAAGTKRIRCVEWIFTITMKSEISKVVRTRSDYDIVGSQPVLDPKSVVRERLKPGDKAALDLWKALTPRLLALQPPPIST